MKTPNIAKSKKISKNILATIAYYDVFSYPMTSFEIWKYIMRSDYYEEDNVKQVDLHQIVHELKQDPLIRFIEEYNGFYFLKGRKSIVEERICNSKISFSKAKRLRRVINIFRFIPFVRMVGVTGRLAMKNTRPSSDWDLLVVLKNGHIWTGRTLVTLIMHLIGKRRHSNKIKDRICLNYFITDKSLEISTKDLYSANEYFFMYPLFGFDTFIKFQLKNRWISSMKPNYMPSEISPIGLIKDNSFYQYIRKIGEFIFGWIFLEKFLGSIEKKKIMKNPKTQKEGGLIQASSKALIFLPELKGPKVFDEFKKKIDGLI